jgi:predicted nucleic acid-binding Zn ribbon protein
VNILYHLLINLRQVSEIMGSYSIGDALSHFLEKSHWKPKVIELRMRQEWEEIVGKTISKYTRSIAMHGKNLTIYTDVAPLKQELQLGKEQLIIRINEYFEERVLEDIIIK